MRKMTLITACVVLAGAAVPGAADERQDCSGPNLDRKIQACTALIESKRESGLSLAAVYRNRGTAHASKKDYDLAIADFSKAIDLNPKYATAYNDRAVAYTNKGDFQHAVADVTRAVELGQEPAAKSATTAPTPAKTAQKPIPSGAQSAKPAAPPKQSENAPSAQQTMSEIDYPQPIWAQKLFTPTPEGK